VVCPSSENKKLKFLHKQKIVAKPSILVTPKISGWVRQFKNQLLQLPKVQEDFELRELIEKIASAGI